MVGATPWVDIEAPVLDAAVWTLVPLPAFPRTTRRPFETRWSGSQIEGPAEIPSFPDAFSPSWEWWC
jgi:hypothetical protein